MVRPGPICLCLRGLLPRQLGPHLALDSGALQAHQTTPSPVPGPWPRNMAHAGHGGQRPVVGIWPMGVLFSPQHGFFFPVTCQHFLKNGGFTFKYELFHILNNSRFLSSLEKWREPATLLVTVQSVGCAPCTPVTSAPPLGAVSLWLSTGKTSLSGVCLTWSSGQPCVASARDLATVS